MKRRRVLALVHEELVPPDSIEGLSDKEIRPFLMEWDIKRALLELGHDLQILGVGDELSPIRQRIAEFHPHVCFNMLTDFHHVGAYQSHVVSYLELLKQPYTGCNPRGILLANDKALSKKVLAFHRVPMPHFVVFRHGRLAAKLRNLEFPLIVKSTGEEASRGISQASIVHDAEALRERVEFVQRNVGTDVIAEEYIPGRELTVGVLGNQRLTVLPVREVRFDKLPKGAEPILTARAKFDADYQERAGIESGPADIDDETTRRIGRLAKRVYRALELSGVARIDLRLHDDGRVFVIEANPNPDLCAFEDFATSAGSAGIPYSALIQRIVELGIAYRSAWKIG